MLIGNRPPAPQPVVQPTIQPTYAPGSLGLPPVGSPEWDIPPVPRERAVEPQRVEPPPSLPERTYSPIESLREYFNRTPERIAITDELRRIGQSIIDIGQSANPVVGPVTALPQMGKAFGQVVTLPIRLTRTGVQPYEAWNIETELPFSLPWQEHPTIGARDIAEALMPMPGIGGGVKFVGKAGEKVAPKIAQGGVRELAEKIGSGLTKDEFLAPFRKLAAEASQAYDNFYKRYIPDDLVKKVEVATNPTERFDATWNVDLAYRKLKQSPIEEQLAKERNKAGTTLFRAEKQFEKALESLTPKSEYLYHGTTLGRAREIAEKGLLPGEKAGTTGSKAIYLSDGDISTGLKGDFKTFGSVSPDRLEVKVGTGWKPIKEFEPSEVNIVTKTSRFNPAFGAKAVTPRYISETAIKGESILDYGAGKQAGHTLSLKGQGFDVTAYDIGGNVVPGIHDPMALTKQYDTVFASNVINVAPTETFLRKTLSELKETAKPGGRVVFNYPEKPRKLGLSAEKMEGIVREYFPDVKRVGGASGSPIWESKVASVAGKNVVKEPWQMTVEEFKNWDFPVPEGGASKTPKTVLNWKKGEYETLFDLTKDPDKFRLNESLGKGYKDWPSSMGLAQTIEKNKPITVYRAIEKGSNQDIIPGSYVSESLDYAKQHGKNILKGQMGLDYEIKTLTVTPKELMTYGDPHEFIFIPQSAKDFHKNIVIKAMNEGKPVPAEVISEYVQFRMEDLPKAVQSRILQADILKTKVDPGKLPSYLGLIPPVIVPGGFYLANQRRSREYSPTATVIR